MDEVLELAEKLSRAIARSTRFLDLRNAETTVMADSGAVELMRKRDEAISNLQAKEQAGEPVEPDEKRELAGLDESVRTNPLLADLFRTQADFHEMLNKVNARITAALATKPPADAPADAPDESE